MKHDIIFLDIDGVLATDDSAELPRHETFAYPFDRDCVAVFNEILSITGAEIVLSSDWKLIYNNDLGILDELFKHNGVIKSPIATTEDLGMRHFEITSYLQENSAQINRFLILDDLQLKIHSLNFVRCNSKHGIKENGIKNKCLTILQGDKSKNSS